MRARLAGLWTARLHLASALVAFLAVAQITLVAPELTTSPIDVTDAQTWMKRDSGLYADIARNGYTLYRCPGPEGGSALFCGNAGWFPGFPLLTAGVSALGPPLEDTGVIIAWLFALGTLVALSLTFLRGAPLAVAGGALAVAAFWPGGVYFFAFFPLSMMLFFLVLALWWLVRERWLWAGVAGALAATAYWAGCFLIPVAALYVLAGSRGHPWRERVRRLARGPGVMLLGPLFVVGLMRVQTNTWDAFFKVQDKYRSGTRAPGDAFGDAVDIIGQQSTLLGAATFVQTLFVAAIVATAVVVVLVRWRRGAATAADWLVLALVAILWAFPTLMNSVALHRAEATLLPAVIVLRHLPAPALWLIASVGTWISFAMTQQFVLNGLT